MENSKENIVNLNNKGSINDIEEMKTIWQEINMRLGNLEEENRRLARKVMTSDFKSARSKLISKYSAFIFLEAVMIFFMSSFIYFNPEVSETYRWPAIIYWSLFFLGELAVDFYLLQKVREIDIYESTINEISQIAASNWKIHKFAIIIGLPMAIGAVIIFALAMNADRFVIMGMIVGGFIGLLIGGFQLMKFMKYYRLLQKPTNEKRL